MDFSFIRNCQKVFQSNCTILHSHQPSLRVPRALILAPVFLFIMCSYPLGVFLRKSKKWSLLLVKGYLKNYPKIIGLPENSIHWSHWRFFWLRIICKSSWSKLKLQWVQCGVQMTCEEKNMHDSLSFPYSLLEWPENSSFLCFYIKKFGGLSWQWADSQEECSNLFIHQILRHSQKKC